MGGRLWLALPLVGEILQDPSIRDPSESGKLSIYGVHVWHSQFCGGGVVVLLGKNCRF